MSSNALSYLSHSCLFSAFRSPLFLLPVLDAIATMLSALSRSAPLLRPAAASISSSAGGMSLCTVAGGLIRSSCRTAAAATATATHVVSSASSCNSTQIIVGTGVRSILTVTNSNSFGSSSSSLGCGVAAMARPAVVATSLNNSEVVSGLTSSFLNLGLSNTSSTVTSTNPTLTQTRTFASRRFHRKKIIKAAKGYRGQANRNFRAAIKRVERARQNAYRDRKLRKREFRKLWIQRLNAGLRQHGLRYSKFINMLNNQSEVKLDRKILSELAMHEPFSFKAVVDVVKETSKDPRQRKITG